MTQMGIGPGPFRLRLNASTGKIEALPMETRDHFSKDFNVIKKVGEGSFGIAYKVVSHLEGGIHRAIKKQKTRSKGVRDTDLRRQEVAKAF